jgi:D-alanyl-D-alanine carboxypeptidase/D-alanyl-D-alanine-endopeptidase (penicillin-binding protein 4)
MNYTFSGLMKGLGYFFYIGLIFLGIISLGSCSSLKERKFEKKITQAFFTKGMNKHFSGFLLYDPETKDTLFSNNSHKLFTPASNTKIFTFLTALKILGDSVPALRYLEHNDTLFFEGTGDPSALHPYFRDRSIINFLNAHPNLVYVPRSFGEDRFAPGWAWEDFDLAFSPERSVLPLYGNVITLFRQDSLIISPELFRDSIKPLRNTYRRKEGENIFYIGPERKDTLSIPYKTSNLLTRSLLEALLGRPVGIINSFPEGTKRTVYSATPADSLYKRMMQESDNFLAEQLLLLSSSVISDTLSGELAREFILDSYLSDLEDKLRWVDGSGLSRYNLFSPASMVFVLTKLHGEIQRDRLFGIFPSGGVNGTLKEWYSDGDAPYLYAKSGSLGNTYCLSGYLLTASGKTLIFSFMNNHFMESTSAVKRKMQQILETVRDNY